MGHGVLQCEDYDANDPSPPGQARGKRSIGERMDPADVITAAYSPQAQSGPHADADLVSARRRAHPRRNSVHTVQPAAAATTA